MFDDDDKPPEKDYTVGYGKPPAETRFKKGTSGNSKGRPKNSKNLGTLIEKLLSEVIAINDKGKRKTITKREAMVRQHVNKAIMGDHRSFIHITSMMEEIDKKKKVAEPVPVYTREYLMTLSNDELMALHSQMIKRLPQK